MSNRFFQFSMMLLGLALVSQAGYAQFSVSAQLRTRGELRDGQGAPLSKGAKPAAFISQRSRLNFSFNSVRIKAGFSVQDVRVWGQDVSTINRNTVQELNGLMLHEAWADILLTDSNARAATISLKIGRQELIYDDQRLLGNLDWLQQARRHDAGVLKFEKKGWRVHAGAAYNQNKENQSGTVYSSITPANYASSTNGGMMYKSMQFLYAARALSNGSASFLFFADQFSRFDTETIDNVSTKTFTKGSWPRYTTGFYYLDRFGKFQLNASAYYQFGKSQLGEATRAYMLTFNGTRDLGRFSAGAGLDLTSGTAGSGVNKSFDPLYGTPHKFWGAMDYFYAGSPFGNGGLADYFIRLKFKKSKTVHFAADLHHFSSASRKEGNPSTVRRLGEEIDLLVNYSLTPEIGFEAGYSHFFSSALLTSAAVKNVPNSRNSANWAYVMINIKPQFSFK